MKKSAQAVRQQKSPCRMIAQRDAFESDLKRRIVELEREPKSSVVERDEIARENAGCSMRLGRCWSGRTQWRTSRTSLSDVQPVFRAIATNAKRLIGGFSTSVFRFADGRRSSRGFRYGTSGSTSTTSSNRYRLIARSLVNPLGVAAFGVHPGALTPAGYRLNVTTDYFVFVQLVLRITA
jgi:hypothetical protein